MSLRQFAALVLEGLLSIVVPLLAFVAMVAVCVYVARWWIRRRSKPRS